VSSGLVQLTAVWHIRQPAQEGTVCTECFHSSTQQHMSAVTTSPGVASTTLAASPETSRVQDCMSCTQALVSTVPMYLTSDIRLISEHGRPHLRTSSNRTLTVPWMCTSFGDESFAVAGQSTG